MSKIVMAIVAILMSGWFSWECWWQAEDFSKMILRKKVKYIVVTIGTAVFIYISWKSISKISWYWRIIDSCISIFVTILLGIGNVPIQLGPKSFETKRDFLNWYISDIISVIPAGVIIFSMLIVMTVATMT